VINIYTDGAASGNPGPGGYAAILEYKGDTKQIAGGYRRTTNNRMELMAVIVALEALKQSNLSVTIHTDSGYIVNSVQKKWLHNWINTDFKGGKKNPDLWKRFWQLYQINKINLVWIKGHSGHPQNELCDKLAVEQSKLLNLPVDKGYENGVYIME